jgi:hypothetical protein
MGQKVGGYRRKAAYGQETVSLPTSVWKIKGDRAWSFEVNPEGRVGWNRGSGGTTTKTYGEALSQGRGLRKEVEEVRKLFGCESNGLGRKGRPWRGYEVHGEYTYTNQERKGSVENRSVGPETQGEPVGAPTGSKGKKPKKKRTKAYVEADFQAARSRVTRKYEGRRGAKVERKRRNLKERRKEKGLEAEKNERALVLGPSTKRRKAGERCEAVTLSGILPTAERRTKLIASELEHGLNHMEVRRGVENLRTHHAKSSQYGRIQAGAGDPKHGYYGYKVRVKGPLGGARRTMTYVIRNGTVPLGTKSARRREGFEHAKTKIGTLGIKVTYCYGIGSRS